MDFAHGQPFVCHDLPPIEWETSLPHSEKISQRRACSDSDVRFRSGSSTDSGQDEKVDGYFRIHWTLSAGFGGRFRPDYAIISLHYYANLAVRYKLTVIWFFIIRIPATNHWALGENQAVVNSTRAIFLAVLEQSVTG